jgi:hypothetical protein
LANSSPNFYAFGNFWVILAFFLEKIIILAKTFIKFFFHFFTKLRGKKLMKFGGQKWEWGGWGLIKLE